MFQAQVLVYPVPYLISPVILPAGSNLIQIPLRLSVNVGAKLTVHISVDGTDPGDLSFEHQINRADPVLRVPKLRDVLDPAHLPTHQN